MCTCACGDVTECVIGVCVCMCVCVCVRVCVQGVLGHVCMCYTLIHGSLIRLHSSAVSDQVLRAGESGRCV